MQNFEFHNAIKKIMLKDPRYTPAAYEFINDAVIFTQKLFEEENGKSRHVSGIELVIGVKEYAVKKFGPMAWDVFKEWGILEPSAIGNMVFNMIDSNLLSKSDNDTREDFNVNYSFQEEIRKNFTPKPQKRARLMPKID